MGELIYRSTRGRSESVTSAKAIVEGIAPDGGLYVPDHIPAPLVSLEEMLQLSYRDLAYAVMKPYLPDFTEEELRGCLQYAYNSRFDTPEPGACAPVEQTAKWERKILNQRPQTRSH